MLSLLFSRTGVKWKFILLTDKLLSDCRILKLAVSQEIIDVSTWFLAWWF